MKLITAFIVILSLLTGGCAFTAKDKTTPLITTYDSRGQVVRTKVDLKSSDYVKMMGVQSAEKSNQEFYKARSTMVDKLESRDIPMFMAIQALSNQKNPTNYNDALIASNNASVQKFGIVANGLSGIAKWGLGGYILGKAIGGAGDSYRTTVDNGSQYRGVQGDHNDYEYREEIGGIPLEPGTLQPITLGSEDEEIAEDNVDCPEGFYPRPNDPSICTDGNGGTADPLGAILEGL